MEIRIKSVNKDNSHTWIRISHGLNKLVTNLNNNEQDDNEQETSEIQFEECALKLNAGDFACRSKAKVKPQNEIMPADPQELYLLGKELGPMLNQENIQSPILKCRRNILLFFRHGSLPRDNDGAIEFWGLKDHLQNHFVHSQHWSDEKWKSTMAKGGGNKKRFQYCTDPSGEILYLRALQGHSGRNLIDSSLQDNVIIPNGFFESILSRAMCNQFTFHHKFRIDTRSTKFEQQTDSVLFACRSYGQRTQGF